MDKKNLHFQFKINCKDTKCGDSVYVSGDINELGNWDLNRAVKLFTSPETFPIWESLEIPFDSMPKEIEYKYFIRTANNKIIWEKFSGNRIFYADDISLDNTECIIINGESFNESTIRKNKVESRKQSQSEQYPIENLIKEEISGSQQEEVAIPTTSDTEISSKMPIEQEEEDFDMEKFLEELRTLIEKIQKNQGKLKELLKQLIMSFKEKRKLDKELLLLIFIHFVNSGQLKSPENLADTFYEHKHHHDPSLARNMYTYLLANINDNNSLLIRSILQYIPTCLDYKVDEMNEKDYI